MYLYGSYSQFESEQVLLTVCHILYLWLHKLRTFDWWLQLELLLYGPMTIPVTPSYDSPFFLCLHLYNIPRHNNRSCPKYWTPSIMEDVNWVTNCQRQPRPFLQCVVYTFSTKHELGVTNGVIWGSFHLL